MAGAIGFASAGNAGNNICARTAAPAILEKGM
jgi:hypothetical protein